MPKTSLSLMILIVAMAWGYGLNCTALAQDSSFDEEVALYEREPFTRLTLDKANGFAKVDIFPLKDTSTATLRIRRIQDPVDQLYDVSQSNVDKIESFGDVLLGAAALLLQSRKMDEAFPYLDRLIQEFPETKGLDRTIEQYYMLDAGLLFRSQRFDESLSVLDEVYARNPNREDLKKVLPQVVGQTIQTLFNKGDFAGARRAVVYSGKRYGELSADLVATWTSRLQTKAKAELERAKQLLRGGKPTLALASSRRAGRIWPNLPGAEAIRHQILAQYPRVTVGVTQRFMSDVALQRRGPESMNWAERRAGRLVRRKLVEFKEFTADGGVYESPVGEITVSSDRQRIDLKIDDRGDFENAGFVVARALLKTATSESKHFDPRWAEFLKSVYLPTTNTVELTFTRPNLRPEAFLPTPSIVGDPINAILAGEFVEEPSTEENSQQFVLRAETKNAGLKEIVEVFYDDPTAATAALLRGEIDVIDRVSPVDVTQLRRHPDVEVISYRVPTLHALAFNSRVPALRSPTFRQGMLYAINRDGFAKNELAGSDDHRTAQVLTALLPIGTSENDPLGYAYDRRLKPREFNPQLGLVLVRLAQAQMKRLAAQQKPLDDAGADQAKEAERMSEGVETSSEGDPAQDALPDLVLAYPDSPIAQAASSAIATDLRRIGIQVTLRALQNGVSQPDDGEWDVLYIETTIQEPFVDIPELVIGHGILGRQGGLVWQAVRSLQEAKNLAEVRTKFAAVHRLSFDHTPLIPLWQIIEHAAHRKHVRGIGDHPVTLYQNVQDWRLGT